MSTRQPASLKFLQPEVLATIDNMYLRARLVVEGFIVGLHRSPYHGFSVEFAEHRAYGPGDDPRYLDWRLYGKTDRFYIKQFEEETNLKAQILLDISRSMHYGSGQMTKVQYGSYLAAALTYLLLRQQDAVGLTLFDDTLKVHTRPSARPSVLKHLLGLLENLPPSRNTDVGPCLHQVAERLKKRGLLILISDLFDTPEKILHGLKHFRHNQHEVLVFQILDPQEVEFDFDRPSRFIDLETGETLNTEPWHIRQAYRTAVQQFQEHLASECRRQRIDFTPLLVNEPLDKALLAYLSKRHRLH